MQNDKKYPFKYLNAYTRNDIDFYFGRDKEIKELYEMTRQSNLLLVYGASGTGKTSLIQCGLANCFETHKWLALTIRRGTNINHSLEKVIDDTIGSDIEYFGKQRKTENETDYSPLALKIKALRLKYFKPIYLIFDQFEELYTISENKEEQNQFFQTVNQLLALNQPVKIIITIREEYLGYLYYFEKIVPDILKKKLRVEQMSRENVKNILKGISENSLVSVKKGEEDVFTDKIFEILDAGKKGMDLPCMQILFDKLYLKNTKNDITYSSETKFGVENLEKLGDLGDILLDLLNSLVVECEEKYNVETKHVWSILTQLTTSHRTKQSRSKTEICGKISSVTPADIANILSFFEKKQIFRNKAQENYEFRHDTLAERVYKSKETKIKIEEQIQRKLEEKIHFEESFLNDIERNESQLNITTEQQEWIEQSWMILKKKQNKELKLKRASLKSVLTLLGRSLPNNSKDFGEMSNVGLNISEYLINNSEEKYLQHISEENITSFTQLFKDVSNAYSINFSFSNDSDGKSCCTKDGIYSFSVKIEKKNIVEIRFSDEKKEKMLTRGGFWGIDLKYDNSDNEIERTYIGLDGKPKLTREGYASIKTIYDKYDNPRYVYYFDENQEKQLHKDGNHGYKSRFDKDGNEIQRAFLDKEDKPVSIYNNIFSIRFEYENGLLKYQAFYDENDNPCYDCFGYHAIRFEYDEKRRETKSTYYNIERHPMISKDGYVSTESIYNENDLPIITKCIDLDGNITTDNIGSKGVKIEYDENDRITLFGYIDEFGKFMPNYENITKIICEYNAIGQVICQKFLGHNQNPTYYQSIGYCVRWKYDDRGLPMGLFFYNMFGNPTYNQNKVHGYLFEYNTNAKKIKQVNVDINIQLTNDIDGNCIEEYHIHTGGKEIVYLYDSDNKLTQLLLVKRDKRGNIVFNASLNNEKHIVPNETGVYITKMKYDRYDNIIQALYFDANENPLVNSDGDFGVNKEYSGSNTLTAEYSLDKDYNIHINNKGYAAVKYEYDKDGIQNGLSYYDADGKPILCKDGYHREIINNQESRYYGCDLKPCDNIWGFSIYLSENINGIEVESYWDVNENPTIDIRAGWHKKTIKNTTNIKTIEYLDINEHLIKCKNGYAVERIINKKPLIEDDYILIEYFDENWKKVNDENDCQKYVYNSETNELKFAFNSKGKKKFDNVNLSFRKKILKVLRYSLILLIPLLAIYFVVLLPLIKWIITKFKKQEQENNYPVSYCIQVAEVFFYMNNKVTMAQSLGIENRDFIYAYNDWRYEDYDKSDYTLVEKFEEEFNRCQEMPKTITFGRFNNTENKMMFYTVDFPQRVMGIRVQSSSLQINPDWL